MNDHGRVRRYLRAELAEHADCNLATIRYYERIGLMPEPPRTVAGYRIYDEAHARRLRFILRARHLGFSIEEIGALIELVSTGKQTCADVKVRTARHLSGIRRKIADLRRIERVLSRASTKCSGQFVSECPVLEALAG